MATRGSNRWRLEEWGEPCKLTTVTIPIYAGGPKFSCNTLARDAMLALGHACVANNYIVRRIGSYNCRRITGGTTHSSHSWGISTDINDDTNPYRRDRLVTDMPGSLIADVYSIKTVDGVQVFRWGGDWDGRPETPNSNYDAMHFEIIATRSELARGLRLVTGTPTLPRSYPVIRRGARGQAVRDLQVLLGMRNTTGQGEFGPRTEAAVIAYQRSRGLVADGIVGLSTWTALLTRQPALAAGAPPPQKIITLAA